MKKALPISISILVIFIIVFAIGEYFTIKRYDVMSGNGNIGLLPIGILFIVLMYALIKIYQAIPKNISPFFILAFLLISTISLPFSINYGIKQLSLIRKSLLKNFDLSDVYQLTKGITIYTNTVFINIFSMCTLIILSVLILMLVKKYLNK
ncbi:hypothetical protein ACFYKT_13915 [Cytobacillus sp. FJAT-53684]|uniref:Uncharacterized protein n=1 Tax=Cytobacillus mangrovibacter TaxID=3299024 RepID=A0ABW6JZU0_9BACI